MRLIVLILVWLFVISLSSYVSTYTLAEHHKLLLISFDGLRWDYVDRRPELEAFQYLQENGVRAEYLIPSFPTFTTPSHFTIATGLYVESHGVIHNSYFNHSSGEAVKDGYYSTLLINEWWDTGCEPIWITASSQGLKTGGYLFPGSYSTINGIKATRTVLDSAETSSDEPAWKNRIDDVMTWFADDDLDFIALFFDQPDIDTHYTGPSDSHVEDVMLPLLNRTIFYILSKVEEFRLKDNMNIIITSDHGMASINTTVHGDDAISVLKYVNSSNILFDYALGPLGLIEPVPGKLTAVYEQLRGAHPHMQVYYKEDFPERFHYAGNDRIPSIILLADSGYEIYNEFPGEHKSKGMHGYDNQLTDMYAAFYAIGPSFKKKHVIPGFESIHIYDLMCHLLGLTPAPNNGSLEVLLPTLEENNNSGILLHMNMFALLIMASLYLYIRRKQIVKK